MHGRSTASFELFRVVRPCTPFHRSTLYPSTDCLVFVFCFRALTRTAVPTACTAVAGGAANIRATSYSHPGAKPIFTDGLRVPAWYTDPYSLRSLPSEIYLSVEALPKIQTQHTSSYKEWPGPGPDPPCRPALPYTMAPETVI